MVECKIYRGDAYNRRGEEQLRGYMDAYGTEKGYLLSFSFHKNKKPGVKEIFCDGKAILEVLV